MVSPFMDRLEKSLRETFNPDAQHKALEIQALAPGVVAVRDSMNEYDTYFDRERWEPTIPEIWMEEGGRCALYPSSLEEANIGVLPGLGRFPAPRGFAEVAEYAQKMLQPISDDSWHEVLEQITGAELKQLTG